MPRETPIITKWKRKSVREALDRLIEAAGDNMESNE